MKTFPNTIPVFPLSGVIYFPKTNLPLNIFEQRYIDLVNDTYNKDKLMGMVQSQKNGDEVYKVGCLGKISDLQKSQDGRILINLTGITRFNIIKEVQKNTDSSPKDIWKTIRIVLTGHHHGPSLNEIIKIYGPEKTNTLLNSYVTK